MELRHWSLWDEGRSAVAGEAEKSGDKWQATPWRTALGIQSVRGSPLTFHHELAVPGFQKAIFVRVFLAALDSVFSRQLVVKEILFLRYGVLRFFSLK